MTLTAQNLVAMHDRDTANYVQERDKFAEKGFRTLSLSIYGTPNDPRFAAVMVKRDQVIAARSFINLSQSQYQKVFEDQAAEGFGPYIITATGPKNGAIFAGAFRKMSHIPLTRSNLSKDEFIQLNRQQHDAGNILIWADCFGTPSEPRYCAIWDSNPGKVAWNIDAVDEGGSQLQQRFEAMTGMGARPALLSVTPSGNIMEMFVDSQIGPWESRVGMTSADYQAKFNANAAAGRWPICVSASGSGNDARFAAIFATREEISPRTFRMNGTPAVVAIDAKMKHYVESENLRGAALAIVKGRQLVYARGYTNAEESYPDVKPTTLFRQASISKSFCAVAVWELIERGDLALGTKMQSVLNLKQPNGSAPKDSRFGDVTVEHLLTSTSGINQGGVWGAVEASQAAGGTLPSDGTEVARWIATLDMTGTPGDKKNAVYGNTDYFLLSLIVAKKMNASSFEAALKTLVLDPLGQTRTRGSRSLTGDQASDEARYHMTVHDPENSWALFQLECGSSDRTEARPLVPTHYGTFDMEMFDGCGGLSSAVIDVARLCAMFACRNNNPVLKKDTIDNMLAAAVKATSELKGPDNKSSHGYHGFDWASNVDVNNHQVMFSKGGWLPGQGTYYIGTTGGLFYIIAQNGNSPKGDGVNWYDEIRPIVEAHDWGTTDLFPNFGMATLPGPVAAAVTKAFLPKLTVKQTLNQVQTSIARSRVSLRAR
jgi:CubicO group peptidase (beta-lactamase class C family)